MEAKRISSAAEFEVHPAEGSTFATYVTEQEEEEEEKENRVTTNAIITKFGGKSCVGREGANASISSNNQNNNNNGKPPSGGVMRNHPSGVNAKGAHSHTNGAADVVANGAAAAPDAPGPKPAPIRKSTPDFWRFETVEEAASYIRSRLPESFAQPEVGIVCGSGCGIIAEALVDAKAFRFEDIPHFLPAAIPGHKGLLHVGTLSGKMVVVLEGRFHAYEGYHYGQAAFPIRVIKLLGASRVVLTMATGGLNPDYNVGDLMILKDHLSIPILSGGSPLRGPNDGRLGPRFVAQNNAYDREWRKKAVEAAQKIGFASFVREGNYVHISGPNYESPMECKFLRMIGGDAVGMSGPHECLVARHMDMKVLGIALISNKCILDVDNESEANHEEVLAAGKARALDLKKYVVQIVEQL